MQQQRKRLSNDDQDDDADVSTALPIDDFQPPSPSSSSLSPSSLSSSLPPLEVGGNTEIIVGVIDDGQRRRRDCWKLRPRHRHQLLQREIAECDQGRASYGDLNCNSNGNNENDISSNDYDFGCSYTARCCGVVHPIHQQQRRRRRRLWRYSSILRPLLCCFCFFTVATRTSRALQLQSLSMASSSISRQRSLPHCGLLSGSESRTCSLGGFGVGSGSDGVGSTGWCDSDASRSAATTNPRCRPSSVLMMMRAFQSEDCSCSCSETESALCTTECECQANDENHNYFRNDHSAAAAIDDGGESSIPMLRQLRFRHIDRRKFVAIASTFVLSSSGLASAAVEQQMPPPQTTPTTTSQAPPPQTPFSTTRTYRNVVLSNGLRVVLVSDSSTLKQTSSASLCISGAGQFSDPASLLGLAHLTEHIVLSSTCGNAAKRRRRGGSLFSGGRRRNNSSSSDNSIGIGRRALIARTKQNIDADDDDDANISNNNSSNDEEENFEEWLVANDGASNGFTAPGFVNFHYDVPHDSLPESLERFARLFASDAVPATVARTDVDVIAREVRRVDSELDRTSDSARAFYWLKSRMVEGHPFGKFAAGSRETLERNPEEMGVDVGQELEKFFRERYLASEAVLVVVGREDVRTLDRWISPFSNTLNQKKKRENAVGTLVANEVNYLPSCPAPLPSSSLDAAAAASAMPSTAATVSSRGGVAFPSNPVVQNNEGTQTIILRSKDDPQFNENVQTLCMEWPLALSYDHGDCTGRSEQRIISAPAVGFVLSQIISRRGPGSLRFFLDKFNWSPKGSSKGVPRFSFPVDVSGFQIIRMEIGLTNEGFANRSAVVSGVFESIRTALSASSYSPLSSSSETKQPQQQQPLSSDLVKQYITTAYIHGYFFAPRPPDAVEISVDAMRFGIGNRYGVGVQGNWPMFPSPDDDDGILGGSGSGVENMFNVVLDTLSILSDESKAIVSIRASAKAIYQHSRGLVDESITSPPLFSPWKRERITGAAYLVESRIANGGSSYFKSLAWFSARFDGEELSPPYRNTLVPAKLRAPRPIVERRTSDGRGRFFYVEDANAYDGNNNGGGNDNSPMMRFDGGADGGGWKLTNNGGWWREFAAAQPAMAATVDDSSSSATSGHVGVNNNSNINNNVDWKLWQIPPGSAGFNSNNPPPMVRPPEPSILSSFVVQLLSTRPSQSNGGESAALASMWSLSFDEEILDLAELGAIAGMAYEISFNTAGVRIYFRGVSQTLPSYVRRFCRRLTQHHAKLMDGSIKISPSVYQKSIDDANRSTNLGRAKKQQIAAYVKSASERSVGTEGMALLKSVHGGYLMSQGDILPREAYALVLELRKIFGIYASSSAPRFAKEPDPSELLYRPFWKPRSSSPCFLPGVCLISDACGRIMR